MARRTTVEILEREIIRRVDLEPRRVFTVTQFREVYARIKEDLDFPQVLTFKAFSEHLQKLEMLSVKELNFPWREFTRFVWRGEASDVEVVATLDPKGYLSHFTAASIHGLTLQNPKSIYFNVEQSPKPPGEGLSQASIDRAFKGNPRLSKQTTRLGGLTVHYLMGKDTGNLGVIEDKGLRYTDVERTLIDIAVRPVHSGGIDEVRQIYQNVLEQGFELSANKLRSYLMRMKFVYPYQQAIGYLLDATGFKSPILEVLRQDASEFNFYLDYGIKDAAFDPKWKIFIPKHFPITA
jgi:predicted transcriptional regulator of viral defense system